MIKILISMVVFPLVVTNVNGQAITLDKLDTNLQNSVKSIKEINEKTNKLQSAVYELNKKNAIPNIVELNDNVLKWSLVFTPLLLFIIVLLGTLGKKFSYINALSENDRPKKTIKNPVYNAATLGSIQTGIPNLPLLLPPTIEVTEYWPSLDDLIATCKAKTDFLKLTEAAFSKANNALVEAEEREIRARQDANKNPEENDKAKRLREISDSLEELRTAKNKAEKIKDSASNEKILALSAFQIMAKWLEENESNNYQTSFNPKTSMSRLIALFAFLNTIVLITPMSCFFIYHYIRTTNSPDFHALIFAVIALGLGYIPYLVNKISGTLKYGS